MKNEYFKDDDTMCLYSKSKVEHSRELNNVNIVIDFDKEDNIVGVEIYDFMKALKESQKEIDRIFKLAEKQRKVGGKRNGNG